MAFTRELLRKKTDDFDENRKKFVCDGVEIDYCTLDNTRTME
jgi:hypothetical protein